MRYCLLLFSLLFIGFSSSAQSGNRDEAAIRALLAKQVDAWNAGSLEGYMHGYWESDSLLFIGKSGPTYGYNATLERYKKSYTDAAHMGRLTSSILSMERLSPACYFLVGKWALERDAGNVAGSWTLLLKKIKGEWVIVADHSS